MSILPQLGRAPGVPIMPERPTGFTQNNNALWMDITGSVVSGAMTALGGQGKDPGDIKVPEFKTPDFSGAAQQFKGTSFNTGGFTNSPLSNTPDFSGAAAGFQGTSFDTGGFKL
jgi:hypothetical protein